MKIFSDRISNGNISNVLSFKDVLLVPLPIIHQDVGLPDAGWRHPAMNGNER